MPGRYVQKIWESNPTLDSPPRYRRACGYEAFIPDALAALDSTVDSRIAGAISEAEAATRQLNDHGGPALAPLARLLLRTESIASSKIEGMQLGVRELARAEAKAESGKQPSGTAAELLANIDAMELAMDEAAQAQPFGMADIVAIHRRLMERAHNPHVAGVVRTEQNWIGGNDYNPCGADFVPPPPEDVGPLLTDLCAAINAEELPPLMQAALVHAQFETIHPFHDGNGRTGRALVHVILRRRRLAPLFLPPISVVFAGARDRYIEGLTRFRADGVAEWIEQFAVATSRAARLAGAYIDRVRALQESWRTRLRNSDGAPRADAAAWAIIDQLPAHPIISSAVAVAATNRTKSRVNEGIDQLVSAGVLIPISAGARNRWWEAEGQLDLIAQLENGELPAT